MQINTVRLPLKLSGGSLAAAKKQLPVCRACPFTLPCPAITTPSQKVLLCGKVKAPFTVILSILNLSHSGAPMRRSTPGAMLFGAIKYFALVGADKMLGNNNLNQSINFSEIRKYLQSIDDKLADISGRQKMDFVETNAEIKTNQSLLNLITKLLHKVNQINIGNYTNDWKYSPLDEYGLKEEKQNHLQELMND